MITFSLSMSALNSSAQCQLQLLSRFCLHNKIPKRDGRVNEKLSTNAFSKRHHRFFCGTGSQSAILMVAFFFISSR